MARLDPLPVATLDAAQRELYERITDGPRSQGPQHFALTDDGGALQGPFNAFLLSPALGSVLQQVGAAVRYQTSLSPRIREVAILMVAAHWDSAFEREAHEGAGRAAGLSAQDLDEIRAGSSPDLGDACERVCADLVRAMLRGDVDDDTWTAATQLVGLGTVFELSTLVGYYATLALQLRVFRVG